MFESPPVLITGATGGLGRKTALELARRGRDLLIGGRRREATRRLCEEIEQQTGRRARPFIADLAVLRSVAAACDALGDQPLHGIVANAGLTTLKDRRSADGYELTFAVNVLAHQLLLARLGPQLLNGGRIVVISSGVHEPDHRLARLSGVPVPRWIGTRSLARLEGTEDEQPLEPGLVRYSTSKLGNVLQARGIQARLRDMGRSVDVFAVDPGLMVDTDLLREAPLAIRWIVELFGRLVTPFVSNMRLSSTSARHVASLIEDERWSGRGFAYLDGDQPKPPSEDAQRDDLVEELLRDAQQLIDQSVGPGPAHAWSVAASPQTAV